ncbi:prepilin-type N-terminal cleavage/methylation domain-containing protein [Pseudomonas lactis]|uniref:Type II secretion system protein H n=1 Tax=Pseudomonas lactis TaxID=1615674 RepID=A0A7Y1PY66_9PSED|nr:GspH/FimT family protein [Pseudomonas lactis]NNA42864.1 prepilin-type N-terminal cleavage/methylation domain-containing protein [Pseudomonas lactis]
MCTTRPTQKGFTLLEMLVVLLMVAVGFGLLASGISQGLKSAQERQVKRDLSLALRQVRSQAISAGQPASLSLDVLRNSYQLPGKTPRRLPDGMTLRLTTAAIPDSDEGRAGIITFYPTGGSSGGHLYLARGTQQSRIDIDWLTGRVNWRDIQQP